MKKRSGSRKRSEKSPKQHYSKYLFILFFLTILAIAILIVRPFLSTLIVSAIVAYVLYPVYRYFFRLTNTKGFSAAILIIMLLLILSLPLILVTSKLTAESYTAYVKVKQVFINNSSFDKACTGEGGIICDTYYLFRGLSDKYNLNLGFYLAQGFSSLASTLIGKASDFIFNIPKFLLHLFVGLFAMYYMFTQGEDMIKGLKAALPMTSENSDRILMHFNDIIFATIHGAIVIAIVQGVIAGIGYFIFGVTSPILLSLLTIITSFIPFLGSALVWLPVSISMLVDGIVTDNSGLMLRAGGLVLWGVLLVSTIDNFLRPKIVGDRARIHPLVILLGVFGGIALFGFVGIIVGPFMLALFMASFGIYMEEKDNIL